MFPSRYFLIESDLGLLRRSITRQVLGSAGGCLARDDGSLGGHCLGNYFATCAARAGLLTKLKLHCLNRPLEFDCEFLALGQSGAELTDLLLEFFELGGEVFFECCGFHECTDVYVVCNLLRIHLYLKLKN